jgi:DNA-binding HxlR family transcriptional regulator
MLPRIGDKWTAMIVGALSSGPMRFNELRRMIGGVRHGSTLGQMLPQSREVFVKVSPWLVSL